MNRETVFLSCDGDGIGQKIGRARLADDIPNLRILSQAIENGNDLLVNWAISQGGNAIEKGGDEALIEVPIKALPLIEEIRLKYKKTVGATLSVGAGKSPSESSKALMVAKLRGKDQTTLYTPQIEEEYQEIIKEPSDEKEKLISEYIKSESTILPLESNHLPRFHALAQKQEEINAQNAALNSEEVQQIKLRVANTLEKLRAQLPVLAHFKNECPDTYSAILEITRCLVELGRKVALDNTEITEYVQKAELPGKHKRMIGSKNIFQGGSTSQNEDSQNEGSPEIEGVGNAPEEEKPLRTRLRVKINKIPPHLPTGTEWKGKIKVGPRWFSVRGGMIQSQSQELDPSKIIFGSVGHPVSVLSPNDDSPATTEQKLQNNPSIFRSPNALIRD